MEKLERMFEQINGNMQIMNSKLDSIVTEMSKIKEENSKLKEIVIKQEEKINSLQREIRKKNIVIKGVEETENEIEKVTYDKVISIIQKIGITINPKEDIDVVKRIGKYKNERKRPILIKLTKESTKFMILKNAKNLKGTDIWIDEDYPKEVQEERRRLIPEMKEARNKGYSAQMKYNKLIINNEVYQAENLTEMEENKIKGSNNNQKRKVDVRSPESNTLVEQLKKITKTQKN